jgi:hypothetical protein
MILFAYKTSFANTCGNVFIGNIPNRMIRKIILSCVLSSVFFSFKTQPESWIRINLSGYKPQGVKVAVWGSKEDASIRDFQLVDKATGKVVFQNKAGDAYGEYGPFRQTYRLNFSTFNKPGTYTLRAGTAVSPEFRINGLLSHRRWLHNVWTDAR